MALMDETRPRRALERSFWKLNEHLRMTFVAPARERPDDAGERARIDRHDPPEIEPHDASAGQNDANRLLEARRRARGQQP
jgi:hypothetical protein